MDSPEIPMQLIKSSPTKMLGMQLSYLKRTRRRTYLFVLNGNSVTMSRRWALDAVAGELKRRAA